MLATKATRKLAQSTTVDNFLLPFLYNTRTIRRVYSDSIDDTFYPADTVAKENVSEDLSRPRASRHPARARTGGQEGYDGHQSHGYARGAASQYNAAREKRPRVRNGLRSRVGRGSTERLDTPMEKTSRTAGLSDGAGGSTMTWTELTKFKKLFEMRDADHGKPSRTPVKLESEVSVHGKQSRSIDHPKPEFPDLLRPLAEEAAFLRAQETNSLAQTTDVAVEPNERSAAYLKNVKLLMDKATLDTELWQILQEQVFKKIEALNIRDDRGVDARLQAAMTKDTLRDFELLTETLPTILLHYMRSIRTSYPGSSLGLVLLPRLKKSGSFAYTLGATTELFNQHMRLLYERYTDLDGICNTLSEMDKEVFEFNIGTLRLLEIIFKHANACRHGQNGPGLQALWLTDRKARALMKLTKWKEVVDEKCAASALKVARSKVGDLGA